MINIKKIGRYGVFISDVPKKLENAIHTNPPDILGLSNYSWNEILNHLFVKIVKNIRDELNFNLIEIKNKLLFNEISRK